VSQVSTDAALAFLIGTVVGVGAALLLESSREGKDDLDWVLHRLRARGYRVERASEGCAANVRTALAGVQRYRREI
jgi:hypothetical protein